MLTYKLTVLLTLIAILVGRYAVVMNNSQIFGEYLLYSLVSVSIAFILELLYYFNTHKNMKH